ncbi:hypothetical protein [Pseudomonas denitrificans (nom. rej.)]|uniref:Uncharacterized protein n=1 Tax=Pseudomonas denitrificans TaxID=43306 RepID=A0A9X7R4U4_PSEDE|nr:hypothetical protein [Pseudomonas denitrificans (nom. rej.)]QEY72832.1 hypothetical protein F1C79_15180 [Pseudomonas denitrificans (nom. rej.)]
MSRLTSVADLFHEEPIQWGLRGDPYLWREMAEHLAATPWPASETELTQLLTRLFEQLAGIGLGHPSHVHLPRHAHGGMSSGMISSAFWRERAIPLLVERYRTLSPQA